LVDFYDLYKLVQACTSLYKSWKVFCKNADDEDEVENYQTLSQEILQQMSATTMIANTYVAQQAASRGSGLR